MDAFYWVTLHNCNYLPNTISRFNLIDFQLKTYFFPNDSFFTVKSPSDTQRSVSQENAFQKRKNPSLILCSNNSFTLIANNFRCFVLFCFLFFVFVLFLFCCCCCCFLFCIFVFVFCFVLFCFVFFFRKKGLNSGYSILWPISKMHSVLTT